MVDVVTVGAAIQDVFLSGKALKPQQEENGEWVEEFPLGAKLDLDEITFSTGGGATNAAVTLARQGQKVAFMGQIGHDPAGEIILKSLNDEGIDTGHVIYSEKYSTGYSTLLLAPTGDRTILTYRGASTHYDIEDFSFSGLEANWLYLSTLSGNMDLVEKLINEAQQEGVKIVMNPGKKELEQAERLRGLLEHVDIMSLNREETELLLGHEGEPVDLMREIAKEVEYFALTDGPNGAWVSDSRRIIKAGMYEDVPVKDRTGAGDAFASGFTAKVLEGKSLEEAVTFAAANSTSVVQQVGAKAGILRGDVKLHDMPIEVIN